MVFGVSAISCNFVPIFFGPGYDKVAYLIMAMAPIVLIIAISNILGLQYLTPSGQIKKSNRAIIIGAITNLIMNITLIYLPYYSPHLNPIEQIWKEIRKLGFRNKVFATLEKVVDRLCDTICSLSKQVISSITGREWIIELFN